MKTLGSVRITQYSKHTIRSFDITWDYLKIMLYLARLLTMTNLKERGTNCWTGQIHDSSTSPTPVTTKRVLSRVQTVKHSLWIDTSDISDSYVEAGKEKKPFLDLLAQSIHKGVEVRLIHAKRIWLCFLREF